MPHIEDTRFTRLRFEAVNCFGVLGLPDPIILPDLDITPCQQTCIECDSPHKAIGLGTNANISRTGKKLACAPTDTADVIIASPENLCNDASRCRGRQSCSLPNDTVTGLQVARRSPCSSENGR